MKKFIHILLAGAIVFLPQFEAFAQFTPGPSESVPVSGTLAGTTNFSVVIRNVSDDAVAPQMNASTSNATLVTLPQYVEVNFEDNNAGFQAVVISTDNRAAGATPQFSPGFTLATGSGLVGQTEAADGDTGSGTNPGELITSAPMQWVVFDDAADAKAYEFVGDTSIEFFIVDRQQDVAVELDIDPDTPGTQSPEAFNTPGVLGFASVIFGVSGTQANLSGAPIDDRTTTDGQVFMRAAVDYTGQSAQGYATSTLTLELITI